MMHHLRPIALSVLLFVIILHAVPSPSSAATDTLRPGHALAGSEKLVSANGKFALGFFQTGSSSSSSSSPSPASSSRNNSYLGIWFDKVPVLTPVWTANRDTPAVISNSNSTSLELIISGDGNLALVVSAQGNTTNTTTIWSTRRANTNTNTATNDTVVAVLLGSGNLVLRSSSNSSLTFWESFDYPTDTMLPGAKIGRNKVTGLNRRLVSRKNSIDQASGIFSTEMGLDGIGRIAWNSSVVYWSTGEWNGKFFNAEPEMSAGSSMSSYTYVNNSQEVYFSYSLADESIIVLSMLDVSGQRKLRVWTGQNWIPISNQPKYQCDVYAVCGPFTVCTSNADPFCSCMKGFSVRSPADWEIQDKTGGCIRNTPLNCGANHTNRTGMADRFYSMPAGIRLPQNGQPMPINASGANECARVCLGNCSCTAYSYGKDGCSVWHGELLNVASTGGDDYEETTFYLRLAAAELESGKGGRTAMAIGAAVGASIAALLVLILLVVIRRSRNGKWCRRPTTSVDHNDQSSSVGIVAFRYADLQDATKKFSEKLGAGGFGSVFKGLLPSDSNNSAATAIAVKRLDDGARQQGEKQFRAEVNSVGVIQHINLVKLIGFCCEGDRRLLVYEHMPNGSLDSHLFQSRHAGNSFLLDWSTRYQIALGVARGLGYLHHGCRDCIIHCDIKPQNILLDASFVPKIADFGMAKLLGREFSRVVTTMRGTVGYLAPEWISGTPVTPKVDVYSYGMVLLEIVSGKRNCIEHYSSSHTEAEGQGGDYLPLQVAHKLLHGDILSIVDADLLSDDVNIEEAERVCKVACWCIQDLESDRPTMIEVVQFLEGICELEMPPMPRLLSAIAGSGGPHQTGV